ncbi:MAG: VWA domain-containing protein [Firmicutes bacterium]|nr:VWA domain-containing protein [Bacillota bacterium]
MLVWQRLHGQKSKVKDYLEVNVVRFIHLLRHAGLRIGSGEVIDALQALTLVGVVERDAVRIALKSTLVKRPGEQAIFEKAFALFFGSPNKREAEEARYRKKLEQREEMLDEANEELTFQGQPLELSEQEKLVYANIPEQDRQKLRSFIEKTAAGKNVDQHFHPILESVVKGSLSYWRKSLRNELDLSKTPQTGDEQLNALLDSVGRVDRHDDGSLLEEDMQNIADKDLPRARALIRKLARQMEVQIARRYRQSNKHKRLDVRKSIRHNMRFGGTMFHLRYRSRRIQKPKLLLLCDVSGSMARYASFALQFIYGINSVVGSIESFVFAEELERVTPYFREGDDFSTTMLTVMNESQEWGRGTHIAPVLQALRREYENILTGQTYILIVSDTKTMAVDDAVQELRQIKRMVKDVVWLNTLPAQDWQTARSVEAFSQVVRMYPCNTLSDLEQVMRQKIIN